MYKRTWFIAAAAAVAVIGLITYLRYRVPEGVEAMGEASEAVVSMLTALFGLAEKILERRK